MSSRFEQHVKVPVLGGAVGEHFQVQVNYGAPARDHDLNEIRTELHAAEQQPAASRSSADMLRLRVLRATLGVVEAEQHVPLTLDMFGMIRSPGGTVTALGSIGGPIAVAPDLRWRQYRIDPDA